MGADPTGKWFDEAHPALLSSPLYPKILAAANQGGPAYRRGQPTIHLDKDYLMLETLLLPLAADGSTVDMLLGITVYRMTARPN